jgi:hypothetical protein
VTLHFSYFVFAKPTSPFSAMPLKTPGFAIACYSILSPKYDTMGNPTGFRVRLYSRSSTL